MGMLPTEEGLEAVDGAWCALGAPPQELQLDFCLPTGQSFRWRRTGDNEYTGVIGDRLVRLRQREDDVLYSVLARGRDAPPVDDAGVLRDYFNLDTHLSHLETGWAASCSRFRDVSPHFPGARMLRQDPLECLFQFICSSNNHISRIHGMVERLCSSYGTQLEATPAAGAAPPVVGLEGGSGSPPKAGKRAGKAGAAAEAAVGGSELSYYAFPTLEQLSKATEEELRAAGFGYRARFIVGTAQALLAKPGGGRAWLLGLRQVELGEAVEALIELPGIGPKVAACICLFSLDKHQAIPVDTHVWQIAVRYYCPQLRGKSLTKKVHAEVQQVFVERFGPYAGWAHNTLFISELATQQHRLPEHLRQGKAAAAAGGKRRGRSQGRGGGGGGEDSDEDQDEAEPGHSSGQGADNVTAAANVAAAALAAAAATGPSSRRGAGRGRQAGQKTTAAAPDEASGAATTRSSSSSEGGTTPPAAAACAAVLDGQTDLGSPPARSGRRRGGAATAPKPEPAAGRDKKRANGKAGSAPAAAQAPADYELNEFDDLVQ